MKFEVADTAYLEEVTNGNSNYIRQIVELFLKQTPDDISTLQTHIQNQNWDEVRKQAHYLKPTFIYVGAKHIHQQITSIEQSAKQKVSLDKLPDVVADIKPQLKTLYKELGDYLNQLEP